MIDISNLQKEIEFFYEHTDNNQVEVMKCVWKIITLLNQGKIRVLNNIWVKKAILLMFRYSTCSYDSSFDSYDKIGLLKYDISSKRYRKAPGALIRNGVYIGNGCVIMPSYINIGAYIGDNTMIDMNASIGSCAQIGKNCHISANSVIGGVLEPISASPVVIEDDCFIGANSAILEGAIVKKGSIISSGVIISSSTKIIDRENGEVLPHGIIPGHTVVVPGSYLSKNGIYVNCAIIIKKVDEKTIGKVGLNDILRNVE